MGTRNQQCRKDHHGACYTFPKAGDVPQQVTSAKREDLGLLLKGKVAKIL